MKYYLLLGKLLYIQTCVKPARTFVNRILTLFRDNCDKKTIMLDDQFHKDIEWILKFLPTFNGITFMHKSEIDTTKTLYLDACLTGLGAIWRDRFYAAPVPEIPDFDTSIVHLEMLNIVVAPRVWGHFWQHSLITIFCDNQAVVSVVDTSKTRDPFLGLCIRNIWLLTARWDIQLLVKHIPGNKNYIADTLSRVYSNRPINWSLWQDIQHNCIRDEINYSHFDLNLHL